MMSRASGLALTLLLIACLALGSWVQRTVNRSLPLTRAEFLEVPPGARLRTVLTGLTKRQLLHSPYLLEGYGRLTGAATQMQAGEYLLEPGLSGRELLGLLRRGQVHQRRFMIVEGWRFREIRTALTQAPRLAQGVPTLTDEAVMAQLGRAGLAPEGRFFPDTYDYVAGTRDLALLARALQRMDEVLAEEWHGRLGVLPFSGPEEALVLASIVEKETGLPEDRPRIAGVLVRRLERGLRLQTDASVIYGLGAGFDGNLTRSDLHTAHPWNTYTHQGLPPTPIATPGRAALRAVLRPAKEEALYFVARGDGTSEFSVTLDEHRRAVRRFQIEARAPDYRSAPPPEAN